jgi:DNA polymerase
MGLNYGIVFPEDEAKANVKAFRSAHPKLVATWKAFGAAARDAILAPGTKVFVETNTKFFFFVQQNFLFMSLPSGRLLSFPFPKWEMWKMPWGDMQMCVTHWWVNTMAGSRWEKRGISGASLMQSAVQGLARDVIMPVAIRLDGMGYPTVLRQHDEILCHVPDNAAYTVDVFLKEFVKVPDWCPDLPITADPWVGPRFKK